MAFKNIIDSLSKDYNISIKKGKDLYAFLINDEFKVYLELSPSNQTFIMYSCICDIPPENREEIYRAILEANYFGTEIDNSTISIDRQTGKIVLFRWFSEVETRYSEFNTSFSTFIGHLSNWMKRIQEYPKHEPVKVEASPIPASGTMIIKP